MNELISLYLGVAAAPEKHAQMGSWFGIGDGVVIMWSLVWVLLPIGVLALISLAWATKNGQFKDAQEIAERQLRIED
jgi:cbb3-type cytochrome oxidase maturation protein